MNIMKFIFGGEKGYYITMNQQKGMPSLKFKIKVSITASDKKGNEIWVKEKEVKDFFRAFNPSLIIKDKKDKFLQVKRGFRIFDKFNKEPIGDYLSLSHDGFRQCMINALKITMDE